METVSIDTSQNVQIDYELASIGDRFLALLLDSLIIGAYMFVLYMVFIGLMVSTRGETAFVVMFVVLYLPVLFYYLLCEIFMDGQSFGKKTMNIKVVKLDGSQASIGSYLLRWIFRPIDIYAYGIGLIVMLVNQKGQRIGDIAAGTTVIKLKRKVSLRDTILVEVDENYEPVFPQVTNLTDQHIQLIKKILNNHHRVKNYEVLDAIYYKTKEAMGLTENKMPKHQFLNTVIKDYNYYAGR